MGFLYLAFFGLLLYLGPAVLLCRKVAARTIKRLGWLMAGALIAVPAVLLIVGGLIDARNAAS
ncbi:MULTISPECIES: hypothetical protein [unclassified Streptomyces]|uniref:hypothetical protein n=1 Tax=unclassified Streptomyces TaxID=2593676 RepID=UPI000DAC692D|nr:MULTISPECIES: hypothetical protein [unclassified Streptomyces]PZT75840.1 hypothetical protein DNK56_20730 [Streptomyces sp. AC1-42W]PZT80207.1 hypothetical protein DNK55_11955 [Streptomyces sp. AC1-42T]